MKVDYYKLPRIKYIITEMEKHAEYYGELSASVEEPIHPVRFIKELQKTIPEDYAMVMDVGTSAIYTSTFFKAKRAGRFFAYNFAMGALGFSIPAAIGARFAKPDSCIIGLVGDGSFGLVAAELETIARVGGNINLILFNNKSYGWIRAELLISYGKEYVDFSTNFGDMDYLKIAEGFGMEAVKVEKPEDLNPILKEAFKEPEPRFIEVSTLPEDRLVPPVPRWIRKAKEKGFRHIK
jgi:acetolactate synthase-1/2/3 large subunit